SLTRFRSSSKLPVVIREAVSDVKNGSGLRAFARSSPCFAASAVTSRRRAGTPAFAKCEAIWEPMVPAPSTATDRMVIDPMLLPASQDRLAVEETDPQQEKSEVDGRQRE